MLKKLLKSTLKEPNASSTPRDKRKIDKSGVSGLIFKPDDLSIDICEQTFDDLDRPTPVKKSSLMVEKVQIQSAEINHSKIDTDDEFLSESEFDPLDTSSIYGNSFRRRRENVNYNTDSSLSISSVGSVENVSGGSASNNPLPVSFNNENSYFDSNYVRFEELLEERLAHIETIKEYHRLKEEYLQLKKDKYR